MPRTPAAGRDPPPLPGPLSLRAARPRERDGLDTLLLHLAWTAAVRRLGDGELSESGDIIGGRFELLERLGSGGMGAVWRARDRALRREVALKEVRPPDPAAAGAGPEAELVLRERVWREARALARLSHPHVVTIHHVVDDEGPYPWLVMELLPGGTLQDRLDAAGPLPPAEAARIGRELLSALSAAHAAGIHHRDVKPANVLLRPGGGAVLTDFGIAALQGSVTLTAAGDVIGSPEYIAPERLRGRDDLPASDLWSLGMLLYVAVEGVNPVRRATAVATLAAVLDEPVPPPRRAGPLAPVLAELLVRDPDARPDAARLDRLLAAACDGGTPPPPPPPAPPGSPSPTLPGTRPPAGPADALPTVAAAGSAQPAPGRRGRRTVAGLAAAAVAGAGLAATGVYLALTAGGGKPPPPARTPSASTATTSGTPSDTAVPSPPASATPPNGSGGTSASPPGTSASSPPRTPPSATDPRPGTWIAQLFSEAVVPGEPAPRRQLAELREEIPEALLLHSSDFASLRPGYWVIYVPGPFTGGEAALAFCAEHGRTTENECVGRYLSHEEKDRELLCLPTPDGGSRGRCTRP
ncbi:protein kinase [Streptomyces sp. F63]|uniref:serine/threonine-protein kinase n=1 Tax=Streptomyces sp. F63 TaxID=2824887 RepID=UPI001B380708|nr:serine/threonine-protein kinase [Streptomyces sp. F63]MBQ0985951.1 protein kinase [Streptomyces sp. F63]